MKLFETKITCECGSKQMIKYKKPKWGPESVVHYCDTCESKIHFIIAKGPKPDTVKIRHSVLIPSDDLKLIRAEEAQTKMAEDVE